MQSPWTSITIIVLFLFLCPEQSIASPMVKAKPISESEQLQDQVRKSFDDLRFPFPVQYNQQVEQYIIEYLTNGRRETEKLLGRTTVYFPLFEHYLQEHQLPDELKYIPFIESRLQPDAKSAVGATGLWQFMPATARSYRLKTTDNLDERLDPHRSTQAAVALLAQLHKEFGDWGLALAAYNCGPGRVKKAIRKTGCDNFWDIQYLLPRQTQKYIPLFLAASYVVKHAHRYGIAALVPKHLPVDNYSVKVHQTVTFAEIAHLANLPIDVIRRLNPGYLRQVVPANNEGRYVILPAQAACALEDHLLQQPDVATVAVSDILVHDQIYSNIATMTDLRPGAPGILPPPPSGV